MTERKRKGVRIWWLVVPAGLLLLLGMLLPVLFPGPSRVTPAAVARVRVGMTRADVEAILGGPPGDYRTMPVRPDFGSGGEVNWERWQRDQLDAWTAFKWGMEVTWKGWEGDEVTVWIHFERGMVADWREISNERLQIGTVELMLWRLERARRRWFSWLRHP
jgi:hypothetical protein